MAWRYLVRRVLVLIPVMIGVSVITSVLMHVTDGDHVPGVSDDPRLSHEAGAILAEAALDYLGFGIRPPAPSWGNMLSNAQTYYVHSVWLVVLPGLLVFITVLAANVLGNAVRDAFDPRLR